MKAGASSPIASTTADCPAPRWSVRRYKAFWSRSDPVKIDIIVVYKVDRLTRSLADFAKLVELFDEFDVSFVSVTQSFNTTSSMGRLTLNVLLSFAQFEREVIGERVRDKIAASKRKGIWVGGPIPLGYRSVGKKLEVVPGEAGRVRKSSPTTCALDRSANWRRRSTGKASDQDPGKLASGKIIAAATLYGRSTRTYAEKSLLCRRNRLSRRDPQGRA